MTSWKMNPICCLTVTSMRESAKSSLPTSTKIQYPLKTIQHLKKNVWKSPFQIYKGTSCQFSHQTFLAPNLQPQFILNTHQKSSAIRMHLIHWSQSVVTLWVAFAHTFLNASKSGKNYLKALAFSDLVNNCVEHRAVVHSRGFAPSPQGGLHLGKH